MMSILYRVLFSVVIVLSFQIAKAQEKISPHIYSVDSTYKFDRSVQVEALSWLSGTWKGQGLGGEVDEIWSEPEYGHMVGMFRYHRANRLLFSEFCSIANLGDGLKYKVKHFTDTFTGWEEKDDFVEFPLIMLKEQAAYFDGATFIREGDTLTVYVYIMSEGVGREEKFVYQRM